jgi:hypothetical protein
MDGNHPSLNPSALSWSHLHALAQATADGVIEGFFSRKAPFMKLPPTLPGGIFAVSIPHNGGQTITTEAKRQELLSVIEHNHSSPLNPPPIPSQDWSRNIALGPAAPARPDDVWLVASYAEDVIGIPTPQANVESARSWLARLLPEGTPIRVESQFPAANIPVGILFRNAVTLGRTGAHPVRKRIRHLVILALVCGFISLLAVVGILPFWCATVALLFGLLIARFHASFWPIDHEST